MKPEQRLDQHENGGTQIVSPSDMAQLVIKQCSYVLRLQTIKNPFGNEQNRSKDTKHAGLQTSLTTQYGQRSLHLQRYRIAHHSPELSPGNEPSDGKCH